jgi:hypothetical protein
MPKKLTPVAVLAEQNGAERKPSGEWCLYENIQTICFKGLFTINMEIPVIPYGK